MIYTSVLDSNQFPSMIRVLSLFVYKKVAFDSNGLKLLGVVTRDTIYRKQVLLFVDCD